MKTHLILLAAVSGLLFTTPSARAEASAQQQSNAQYQKGLAAEEAGDPTAARVAYEHAIQLNPQNANARYRLGLVKTNYAQLAAKGRKAKLESIVIPEFKVEQATFRESLTALQLLIEKESKEEVQPNFIIQEPTGNLAESKVSLQVKNVPAGTILNYLLEQVSAKVRFDEHAIVLTPR